MSSTGQARVAAEPDGIDLYWLPLGAGGHSVRAGTARSTRHWPRGTSDGPVKTSTTRHSRCATAAAGTS